MCRCAPPRTKGGRRAGDRAPISGRVTAPALPPTSARSRARAACRPRGRRRMVPPTGTWRRPLRCRLSALRRRTSGAASRGGAGAWCHTELRTSRPAVPTSTPRPKAYGGFASPPSGHAGHAHGCARDPRTCPNCPVCSVCTAAWNARSVRNFRGNLKSIPGGALPCRE